MEPGTERSLRGSGRLLELRANGLVFGAIEWGPPDGPLALLLHGFPQRALSWTGVAERLASVGVRCVAVDQRGYSPGARPTEVAAYAMPNLVADVVELLGAVSGPRGAVNLVGHDWGGVVGWQVASRRPDLVRTWTAVSTASPLALDAALARDEAQRWQFAYITAFREVGTAEAALLGSGATRLAALYGGAVAPDRVAADVAFFSRPGMLTAALNWYRAMRPDVNVGLPRLTVPTTYHWGSSDLAFGREAASTSGEFVDADYRFVPLEGASHWLPDEAPDTVADAIADRVLG